MNWLMLLVLVLIAFCYFGGKYCPKVLKDNKEMLLGVFVGLTICSFMSLKVEGFDSANECEKKCSDEVPPIGRGIWDGQAARSSAHIVRKIAGPDPGTPTVSDKCATDYSNINMGSIGHGSRSRHATQRCLLG